MSLISTNYLVIGSGIAGLTFAVKVAERFLDKNIVIVTKGDEDESNTKYAQGGIAVVLDTEEDSFQKHIKDTLIAGDSLCDEKVVEMVIKEGPQRLKELIAWEANFDLNSEGGFDLGKVSPKCETNCERFSAKVRNIRRHGPCMTLIGDFYRHG